MKYSEGFERDWNFYLKNRHSFTFSGSETITPQYSKDGVDGKYCYWKYDSTGKLLPTKHPSIVKNILNTKASVNFMIKMWAEDRAKGYLPKVLFNEIIEEFNLLDWIVEAVENQKFKYYEIKQIQC